MLQVFTLPPASIVLDLKKINNNNNNNNNNKNHYEYTYLLYEKYNNYKTRFITVEI